MMLGCSLYLHPGQQYPGDGYNHELSLTRQHIDGNMETGITCPCGQSMIISGRIIREDGSSDVVECPHCHSWHSILWRVPCNKPRLKSHFTFLGAVKPKQQRED